MSYVITKKSFNSNLRSPVAVNEKTVLFRDSHTCKFALLLLEHFALAAFVGIACLVFSCVEECHRKHSYES